MEKKIINNVEVTTEGNVTHFVPVKEEKSESNENIGFFKRIINWFKESPVTPYIKVRNLSDPFGDKDYEGGTKSAIEAGVKVSF